MVVAAPDASWRDHIAADEIVDLIADRDARVHHAAVNALRSALDAATAESAGATPSA